MVNGGMNRQMDGCPDRWRDRQIRGWTDGLEKGERNVGRKEGMKEERKEGRKGGRKKEGRSEKMERRVDLVIEFYLPLQNGGSFQ